MKLTWHILFQRTSFPIMHIISSPCSANLDPKGYFQTNWARIILIMEKVLQLLNYLITVLTFPLFSHNQFCRRSFPSSCNLCSIRSIKKLSHVHVQRQFGKSKGIGEHMESVWLDNNKLAGVSLTSLETTGAETHLPPAL